jgi:hypothetical protein
MAFADYGKAVEEFKAKNPRPEVQVTYFAMKNGEVKKFAQHSEATEFSQIIERVVDRSAHAEWERMFNRLKNEQLAAWKESVRTEYPMLSTRQFDRAFDLANSQSDTYDELEDLLDEWYRAFFN